MGRSSFTPPFLRNSNSLPTERAGSNLLIKLLSSVFYLGYSKFLPGTLASLAAFFTYIFFIRGNTAAHLASVLIITNLGFLITAKAEELFKSKDAREIVIDDFNGMLAGLLFLPYSLSFGLLGFILFRIMDGLKPYPICKIDKLKGGMGVMGDDLMAGLFVNIILRLLSMLIQTHLIG